MNVFKGCWNGCLLEVMAISVIGLIVSCVMVWVTK